MIVRRIVIEVPAEAGEVVAETLWSAVCDAAHDAEPEDRDGWDISVYSYVTDECADLSG